MKKLARSVPEVGEPWPVPSAPKFLPARGEAASAADIAGSAPATPIQDERETPADQQAPAEPRAESGLAQDDARRAESAGGIHLLLRVLLGVALLVLGLLLAGDALKRMIAPLSGVVDALRARATLIGFAAIALAIVDFLLDLMILRPLVGDGLPQIAAFAGGIIAAKAPLARRAALAKFEANLTALESQATMVGWACLLLGLLHLAIGGKLFL
jgi:hypothetical protein